MIGRPIAMEAEGYALGQLDLRHWRGREILGINDTKMAGVGVAIVNHGQDIPLILSTAHWHKNTLARCACRSHPMSFDRTIFQIVL